MKFLLFFLLGTSLLYSQQCYTDGQLLATGKYGKMVTFIFSDDLKIYADLASPFEGGLHFIDWKNERSSDGYFAVVSDSVITYDSGIHSSMVKRGCVDWEKKGFYDLLEKYAKSQK